MKIGQVVESKEVNEIYYIDQSATIEDAAHKLSTLRIGSLLVSPDGKQIEGIISERDIVRELGVSKSACLTKAVSELMTSNVKTVDVSAETGEALEIMSRGRFRHLPVMEGKNLIGLISIGDVVSARLKEIENENSALTDMISGASY